MLLAILLSFAWTPVSHAPAQPAVPVLSDRPFFVGEMVHLIPRDRLAFRPRETATPVLDESGSRLYVGTSDGYVRCRFHGEPSWSWKAGGSILAAPLLLEETLYVPVADGRLTALNRITGEVRWEADVHEELTTTPVFADDKLFVSSSEESVTAVDVKTGKLLWKFHRDPPPGFTIRGNARPQVAHKTVFAGFADGTVAALDPSDGVAKWTRSVSGTGDYLDVDAIAAPEDDNLVYAASTKAGIVALDVETGNPAWTSSLPGANRLLVDGPRLSWSESSKVRFSPWTRPPAARAVRSIRAPGFPADRWCSGAGPSSSPTRASSSASGCSRETAGPRRCGVDRARR
jgi:outer membrane protein assembly factor BamB